MTIISLLIKVNCHFKSAECCFWERSPCWIYSIYILSTFLMCRAVQSTVTAEQWYQRCLEKNNNNVVHTIVDVLQSPTANIVEKRRTRRYHPQQAKVGTNCQMVGQWLKRRKKQKATKSTTLNQFRRNRTNSQSYINTKRILRSTSKRKQINFRTNCMQFAITYTRLTLCGMWSDCVKESRVCLRIFLIIHSIHTLTIY